MELQTNESRFYKTRKTITSKLLPAAFHALQRFHVDLLPRHYYSEIPNIRLLKDSTEWRRPLRMDQIRGSDPADQLKQAQQSMPTRVRELAARTDLFQKICAEAGYLGFGEIEVQALIGFVAQHRPQAILQVGCGVSTAAILEGASIAGYRPQITCIEPYPSAYLRTRSAYGDIELLEVKAQSLEDSDILDRVARCDLLFIDSSHTLGPAGEVTRIIVGWLPQLKDGAFAHFHDIHFPYDYSPSILTSALFFWHETALLHAFLSGNSRFEIAFSMSMLHHYESRALTDIYAKYLPCEMIGNVRSSFGHYPCSVFIRALGPSS